MPWNFHNKTPVYMQIVAHIRADVLEGRYPSDTQIPPVRQLAMEAGVNPNTMQRAMTELEREGLLYTHGTAGRFVTADTEILRKARIQMHNEVMRTLLDEAKAMGVTTEELIAFIQREGETS